MRTVVLALLSLGCAARVDVVATHERERPSIEEPIVAECRIVGSSAPDFAQGLFASRDHAEPYAHFNGRTVSLAIHDVPALLVDRVGLRTRTPSGFSFDGWTDRGRLTFASNVRIPIAGDVAWIPRGAPLNVKIGQGKNVLVAVPTRRLAPVEAMVPCEGVGIGHIPPERELEMTGDLFTLAGDRIAISPTRGAPPTFTLKPRPGATLIVSVEDFGDGLHLRFSDRIEVQGWVERSALAPLPGIGMAGCGGCGSGTSHGFRVPKGARLARVRKSSRVLVGEDAPTEARGTVAAGSEVIVTDELSGFARVLPRCQEILPSGKLSFFVSRADLERETPIVTLPACP